MSKSRSKHRIKNQPEVSTQGEHAIYDPCSEGSRLGVTLKALNKGIDEDEQLLEGVDGLHFHTLCEQNSDDLKTTLDAVEEKFGKYSITAGGLIWVEDII